MDEWNGVLYLVANTINNMTVIMKEWSANFNFQNEILKSIQIWVKFLNLPLNCWGGKSLSKISTRLGTPLYVDDCTTNISRISYARLLIEMDVTRPLSKHNTVQDPNGGVFE